MANKGDDDKKIFVGGINRDTTEPDMKEYFEKFGEVTFCNIKTDSNTGVSRGFGFVIFGDTATVDKVLATRSHNLHGRKIDPKRVQARGEGGQNQSYGRQRGGGQDTSLKVFVGGVDPSVDEEIIRAHFEQYGIVTEVNLPYDKEKAQRRSFVFVGFDSEATADAACEKNKQIIAGKECYVKKATPKPDDGQGGGRGGGNSGGGGWDQGYGAGEYDQGGWGNGAGYDNGQGYGGGYDYSQQQGWGGGWDQSQAGWNGQQAAGGWDQAAYAAYGQQQAAGYGQTGYDQSGYGQQAGYDQSGYGQQAGYDQSAYAGQQAGYGQEQNGYGQQQQAAPGYGEQSQEYPQQSGYGSAPSDSSGYGKAKSASSGGNAYHPYSQ